MSLEFWRIAKYNVQRDEVHVLGMLCTFIWGPLRYFGEAL